MKRYFILILLGTLTVVSCMSPEEKKAKMERERLEKTEALLDSALARASCSDILETETFLGYKFGMSENEVKNHTRKLIRQGKLSRTISYTFHGEYGLSYKVRPVPRFYKGKMYALDCYATSTLTGTSDGTHVMLAKPFGDSRGVNFEYFITKDVLGESVYTYIKDNMVVRFSNGGMHYINAPIETLAMQEREQEKHEMMNKSVQEF